jgi:glycosyltransferase involved in cell wall biosynthesis
MGKPGAVRREPAVSPAPEARQVVAGASRSPDGAGPPSISAIVPLLDECATLAELHARLAAVLRRLCGDSYEIIFVDDGSTDGSTAELRRLAADPRVIVVELRRNFGKAAALAAGLVEARGDIVVTLDADLQDVPEELPRLLEPLAGGVDLVTGRKRLRRDPQSRILASWVFNRLVSWISGVRVRDVNSGFKVMRREVMQELPLHAGLHRYLPAFARAKGFMIAEVDVSHEPRRHGRSRYGANRYLPGLLDPFTVMLLTRYDKRPFHFFGLVGLVLALCGFGALFFLSVGWLFGQWIGNRPLLILGVLLVILGVQSAFFGVLAQLIVLGARDPSTAYAVRRVTRGGAGADRPTASQ